ncbi:hypothetical protein AAHE18_18G106300 [Arachis hypogaea]
MRHNPDLNPLFSQHAATHPQPPPHARRHRFPLSPLSLSLSLTIHHHYSPASMAMTPVAAKCDGASLLPATITPSVSRHLCSTACSRLLLLCPWSSSSLL